LAGGERSLAPVWRCPTKAGDGKLLVRALVANLCVRKCTGLTIPWYLFSDFLKSQKTPTKKKRGFGITKMGLFCGTETSGLKARIGFEEWER